MKKLILIICTLCSFMVKKEETVKSYFITYPYEPTEALFRAALGGSWTTQSTFSYSNTNNLTFTRKVIDLTSATSMTFSNCDNLVLEYCIIKNAPIDERGLDIQFCNNVTIRYCYFENNGVHIFMNANNEVGIGNYDIYNNVAKNATGEGHTNHNGQFCQIIHAQDAPGCSIYNNYVWNDWTQGADPEDVINIYSSEFLSGDSLQIYNNYIKSIGDYTGSGPSTSGGGIICSDNGSRYVSCHDNVVVDPGQYGIANASGTHIAIYRNKVRQIQTNYSNVGIYSYDINAIGCSNVQVTNNDVYCQNSAGSNNGSYFGGTACTSTTNSGNNFTNSAITRNETPPVESTWWIGTWDIYQSTLKSYRLISTP